MTKLFDRSHLVCPINTFDLHVNARSQTQLASYQPTLLSLLPPNLKLVMSKLSSPPLALIHCPTHPRTLWQPSI